MNAEAEDENEKQVRLHHERECARIAKMVQTELGPSRGFVLMTVTRGEAGADFSSLDWVSSVDPEDGLRLLRDFTGRLTERTGIMGEPTHETSSVMREHVYAIMEGLAGEPPPPPQKLWEAFARARKEGDPAKLHSASLALAIVAMLEIEHLQRQHIKRQIDEARPPRGNTWPRAKSPICEHGFTREVDQHGTPVCPQCPPRAKSIRATEPPKGDTKTTLVADLESKPQSGDRDALILMAKTGAFHDFDSQLETPKVTLHKMLTAAGFNDLAEKVVDGAYDDEHPTVQQVEEMRQQLGAETYDAIMGERPRGKS